MEKHKEFNWKTLKMRKKFLSYTYTLVSISYNFL